MQRSKRRHGSRGKLLNNLSCDRLHCACMQSGVWSHTLLLVRQPYQACAPVSSARCKLYLLTYRAAAQTTHAKQQPIQGLLPHLCASPGAAWLLLPQPDQRLQVAWCSCSCCACCEVPGALRPLSPASKSACAGQQQTSCYCRGLGMSHCRAVLVFDSVVACSTHDLQHNTGACAGTAPTCGDAMLCCGCGVLWLLTTAFCRTRAINSGTAHLSHCSTGMWPAPAADAQTAGPNSCAASELLVLLRALMLLSQARAVRSAAAALPATTLLMVSGVVLCCHIHWKAQRGIGALTGTAVVLGKASFAALQTCRAQTRSCSFKAKI